jgi:hypothetical protein
MKKKILERFKLGSNNNKSNHPLNKFNIKTLLTNKNAKIISNFSNKEGSTTDSPYS